jgi:uncharacterized BrkB/YihY/UPF0761 family membrane protein
MRRAAQWVYSFWWGDGLADDVPALTYYLLLSVAPFALGLAAVEALLLEDYVSAVEVARQVNRYLPDEIHSDVQQLILGTRSNSPYLLVIAIVAMLWTSSGAIGVVERVVSRMLGGERHNIVFGRLRNMALGALVAALVIAAAGSATGVQGLTDVLGLDSALPGEVLFGLNAGGAIVLLAVIYRTAPLQHLQWSSALLGALPAGLAIQVIPNLVGVYVTNAGGFAAVRLFLVLAAVLVGLYSMATVLLIGAGVAARKERGRATPTAADDGE